MQRYQDGWRLGKPIEDPDKLKRWGFVTAKPSEYLVFVNSGRIDLRKSGQGQRVWKWPWSSVAIVPTSLQQIDFVADQITRERVGVSVSSGMGARMGLAQSSFQMDGVLAWTVILVAANLLIQAIVIVLERWLLRYRPEVAVR